MACSIRLTGTRMLRTVDKEIANTTTSAAAVIHATKRRSPASEELVVVIVSITGEATGGIAGTSSCRDAGSGGRRARGTSELLDVRMSASRPLRAASNFA